MNQYDIITEIEHLCGLVIKMNNGWFHFVYRQRQYFFIPDEKNTMIRICIPFVVNTADYNVEIIKKVVNETNRKMKYVKAMVLKNGCVSLNYDHKICHSDDIENIVEHMVWTLFVASEYMAINIKI